MDVDACTDRLDRVDDSRTRGSVLRSILAFLTLLAGVGQAQRRCTFECGTNKDLNRPRIVIINYIRDIIGCRDN